MGNFSTWAGIFRSFSKGLVGVATILGGCFTAGWGASWGLQKVFDTQLSRAEFRMDQKLISSETKLISLHNSGIESIKGQLQILIDLNRDEINARRNRQRANEK